MSYQYHTRIAVSYPSSGSAFHLPNRIPTSRLCQCLSDQWARNHHNRAIAPFNGVEFQWIFLAHQLSLRLQRASPQKWAFEAPFRDLRNCWLTRPVSVRLGMPMQHCYCSNPCSFSEAEILSLKSCNEWT
jgi:hypothetical protein